MADVAVVAKDLLVAAGVGVFAATSGWSIAVGKQPDAPNTVVTVVRTGGTAPSPKWLLDFPKLQVRVRGAPGDYQGAVAKAQAVKEALLGLPSQDLSGDRWVSVTMASDINTLGWDESNRPMFSLNFSLIIEPAAGTYRQAL